MESSISTGAGLTTRGIPKKKTGMKPPRETNVGVAHTLKLTPKKDHIKTDITAFFVNFFMQSPKWYLNEQI